MKSQEFLLKIATPDSIARSKYSELCTKWDEIKETYFGLHSGSHLNGFLSNQIQKKSDEGIVIQITTHGPLLQHRKSLVMLQESLNFTTKSQIVLLMLQQFDTEVDFCFRIRYVRFQCIIIVLLLGMYMQVSVSERIYR